MPTAPKKKNHHYVPRLILRKFSTDERRISLVVLSSGKRVDGASLGDQCCEDNFYAYRAGLEEAWGKVEGDFAQVLGDLGRDHLEGLTDPDILQVILYVHFQQFRTMGAATDVDTFFDSFARRVFSKHAQKQGIDLELVRINARNPQQESLEQALKMTPLLLDLDAKFLISDKRLGFVISDDPVVSYNQWVEHEPHLRQWPGGWGVAIKGLQLFLPVSPRVTLCVYDPSTYQCGSPARRTTQLAIRDIQRLNDLQAVHANECLYFNADLTPREELQRLQSEWEKHLGWRKPTFIESPAIRDGKPSQFIGSFPGAMRLGIKLGCMRVTETKSYEEYNLAGLPVRSGELVSLFERGKSIFDKNFDLKKALGLEGVPKLVRPADSITAQTHEPGSKARSGGPVDL